MIASNELWDMEASMPWVKDGNVGIDRPDIKVFETYHNYIFQVFTSNTCITINILLKSVDNIEI